MDLVRKEKKDKFLMSLIIIGIILNIGFFGYLASNTLITGRPPNYGPISTALVVGISNSPSTLDPVNAIDRDSTIFLEQVVETLFTYDLSNHSLPRISLLAETYWWESNTILHIKLKEAIKFHDGTDFDADTAKWNFDRLLYLTNCTGTLPATMVPGDFSSLYFFADGVTPIIKNVVSDSIYNITITLNDDFAPFLDLLCHISSAMLSPASTPPDDFIDLSSQDLVGTGPFSYVQYFPDIEVRLKTFDDYWQGEPWLEKICIEIITVGAARNNAMLNHEIDWLSGIATSYLPAFEEDSTITVKHYTDEYYLPSLTYQYLGMNNKDINITWRKAISYAINYSYIIDEIMNGLLTRATGPISPSYGASYNASVVPPDYNLVIARQTLVDAGYAPGLPVNNNPFDAQWLAANLLSVNYSYNVGNSMRENIYVALSVWLPTIGITVIDDGITWDAYIRKLFHSHDDLGLFWIGYYPDYLDPFNMLDPLFNPASYANSAQVNDTKLNNMMSLALQTTDDAARNDIYKNIQWYLAARLHPHCFGYNAKITYVHKADLQGIQYNALEKFYAYPIYDPYWHC